VPFLKVALLDVTNLVILSLHLEVATTLRPTRHFPLSLWLVLPLALESAMPLSCNGKADGGPVLLTTAIIFTC
jgi:hypothetical protein